MGALPFLTKELGDANPRWRDMVGRGSGEAFQLELSGNGAVYVQASEEKL